MRKTIISLDALLLSQGRKEPEGCVQVLGEQGVDSAACWVSSEGPWFKIK